MNLLAIETSTPICSVALANGGVVTERIHTEARQHTQVILPMVDDLLKAANLAVADIDMIAYGAGPGAFTGLRVGISVAQGLGFGANVKLCGVSSLAIVAAEVLHTAHDATVCVAQDARMGEVYTARYRLHQGLATAIGQEQVCPPAPEIVAARDILAGDAWERLPDLQALAAARDVRARTPRAKFALEFARSHTAAGTGISAAEARLNYIRDKVTH